MVLQKRYSVLGWLFSILFHSVLAVICLMIFIDMSPRTPEYAELTFSNLAASGNPEISKDRSIPATPPSPQRISQTQSSQVVDLPKKRMVDTDDKIPVSPKRITPSNESIVRNVEKIDPLRGISRESQTRRDNPLPMERRQPGARRIEVGEKVSTSIPSEGIVGDLRLNKPYEISWKGGVREVLSDPLPDFPENVFKEVILKFRIDVLPNGTVHEIVPLQKGEATLESITKKSLKQWLFNPLENSAPQEKQSGVVTFRFILK